MIFSQIFENWETRKLQEEGSQIEDKAAQDNYIRHIINFASDDSADPSIWVPIPGRKVF